MTYPDNAQNTQDENQALSDLQSQPPGSESTPTPPQPVTENLSKSKRKSLILGIIGLLILTGAVIAIVYAFFINKPISAKDVSAAETETSSLNSDVKYINDILSGSNKPTSYAEFNSQFTSAQTKIVDAEKQYALLQKSNALKDATTKQSFQALTAKWSPYDNYVNSDLKDANSIFPALYQFTDSGKTLNASPPTTLSGLISFLTSAKQLTDKALSRLSGVRPILSENQEGLNTVTSYLTSASLEISAGLTDLQTNNIAGMEKSLSGLSSGEVTLNKELKAVDTKSNNHDKQVDPSVQIAKLKTSLDNLQSKVNK